MKKRGQAAIEFLLTYWWAVLIIIVMIGVMVYFGVTELAIMGPEVCEAEAPLTCIEKPSLALDSKTIGLVMRNNLGFDIEIYNLTRINAQEGGSCRTINDVYINYLGSIYDLKLENVTIKKEHNFIILIDCSKLQKGKTYSEFRLSYLSKDTGLKHHSSILVKGIAG